MAPNGWRYILKPELPRFAFVPQNEHLTMTLARLIGLEVPASGLSELTDAAVAYLIKRFDRGDDGTKFLMEDICQLAPKPSLLIQDVARDVLKLRRVVESDAIYITVTLERSRPPKNKSNRRVRWPPHPASLSATRLLRSTPPNVRHQFIQRSLVRSNRWRLLA